MSNSAIKDRVLLRLNFVIVSTFALYNSDSYGHSSRIAQSRSGAGGISHLTSAFSAATR